MKTSPPLSGKVALVAGATRGAGRGIACALGEAGATVYCTGRSVRGQPSSGMNRPETIDETAELVSARGGTGIAVQTDHSRPAEVKALLQRITSEQQRLDLLINDIWGGDRLTEWGKPFWEQNLENGLLMQQQAIHTHLITAHYAAPLLIRSGKGLIVEITDGHNWSYRGNLFYDLAKTSNMRLSHSMSHDLMDHGVTAITVTPGFLRSEAVLDHFGVGPGNWEDAIENDPHFAYSESPLFVGRCIAALAADPEVWRKAGKTFASWSLAKEYVIKDVDGRQPDWGRHARSLLDNNWPKLVAAIRQKFERFPEATINTDREQWQITVQQPDKPVFEYTFPEMTIMLYPPEEVAERYFRWYTDRIS